VAQASPKRQKRTTEVPRKEVSKLLERTTIQPSLAKQTAHLRISREEKGKDKVGDDVQTIPAVAGLPAISKAVKESIKSPLSGVVASITEFEMMGTLPRERIEAEPTRATTESHSNDMPEALRVGFLSSLFSTNKLLQKRRSIPRESHEAGSPEKVLAIEECDSLTTVPLSGMPSSLVPIETRLLSESDKETERYIERILTGMIVEEPFVQISPDVEGVGKPLELNRVRQRR
jgi:hypothetical protein